MVDNFEEKWNQLTMDLVAEMPAIFFERILKKGKKIGEKVLKGYEIKDLPSFHMAVCQTIIWGEGWMRFYRKRKSWGKVVMSK